MIGTTIRPLGFQLSDELGYKDFYSMQRVYNRAREKEPEAKDLPSIGKNKAIAADAEAFIRKRFKASDLDEDAQPTATIDFEQIIKDLEWQVHSLLSELQVAKSDKTQFERQYHQTHSDYLALFEDLKKLESRAIPRDLSNELAAEQEKNQNLKTLTDDLIDRKKRLEQRLKELDNECNLRIAESADKSREIEKLTNQLSSLESVFSAKDEQLETLEEQLEGAEIRFKALERAKELEAKEFERSIELLNTQLEKVNWRFKIPTRLDLINYSEMGLSTFGLYTMLGGVGLFVAIIGNAFYFDAQKTLKNENAWDSASFGLFVTFILTACYTVVHYNTFMKWIPDSEYSKWVVSIAVSVLVSGLSFAALWQSHNKTTDGQ